MPADVLAHAEFSGQGDVRYPFVCNGEGDYALRFSSKFALEDKLVTLDYEIKHYILGVRRCFFWLWLLWLSVWRLRRCLF